MLHIVDSSKQVVASYSYDPYGKPTITSDTSDISLGTVNPLCYRGYVYDAETGFYYLQSRYYDSIICRFINSDAQFDNAAFAGYNLFFIVQILLFR